MFQQHNFESSGQTPDLAVLRRELRAIARDLQVALGEPRALPGASAARASMARIRGGAAF